MCHKAHKQISQPPPSPKSIRLDPFWGGRCYQSKTEKSAVLLIPVARCCDRGEEGGLVYSSRYLCCYPETAGYHLAPPCLHSDFPLPFQPFLQPSTQLSFFHMYYWCHSNFGQRVYQYNTPILMPDRLYTSVNAVQNIQYWLSAVFCV